MSASSRRTLVRNAYYGVRWVRFSTPFDGRLPAYPCCYCVFSDGRLIYVGQTNSLRDRIAYHRANQKFPSDAQVKARFGDRYGDWAMRELRLIKRLQPPMNARVV